MAVAKKPMRKPRASILDMYQREIQDMLLKGCSYKSAYNIINYDLPNKISYPTFLTYCKNRLGL